MSSNSFCCSDGCPKALPNAAISAARSSSLGEMSPSSLTTRQADVVSTSESDRTRYGCSQLSMAPS